MIIRVDGHDIPVLTGTDIAGLAEADQAKLREPVRGEVKDGHLSVTLAGDSEKATMYDVKGNISPKGTLDFTLIRPAGSDENLDIASLRPLRVRGRVDHEVDALHQIRLFHAVGSVTVAGGHVEMAMRKVLVSLRDGKNHDAASEVPAEWSNLSQELLRLCGVTGTELATKVEALLQKAESENLRDRRNDIIHGYWWLLPMSENELMVARYFRPKANLPPGNSHPSPKQLQDLAGTEFVKVFESMGC